jgi:hypothetical protein
MSARTGVVNRPFKQMVAAEAAATSLLSLCYLKTSLSFGMANQGRCEKLSVPSRWEVVSDTVTEANSLAYHALR